MVISMMIMMQVIGIMIAMIMMVVIVVMIALHYLSRRLMYWGSVKWLFHIINLENKPFNLIIIIIIIITVKVMSIVIIIIIFTQESAFQ